MSQERRQVLEMLALGKITAEDAERLLDKLQSVGKAAETGAADAEGEPAGPKGKLKFLRLMVDGKRGDKVNIRIPLSLVRAGIKLSAVMPEGARTKLAEKGVDLSALGRLEGEELYEALRELNVDVDGADGDTVRIFCC